ncbi:hypothetical protein O181_028194 [Austropuccinia psidii MF-1]|uniref:Uncharacterized protein n=1 Tax=Austropuccinia psidii MF-1 TaxID=1389203 RepID=A0A9Q3CQ91_9BASI|nr:hypothetical protein [Austropuccinia psidii MF-1]
MKEIHGRRNRPWWKSKIIQKYSIGTWIWQKTMSFENYKYSLDKDPYESCLGQSKRLKAIDPQRNIQMRNQKLLTQMPGELEHTVKCRCNPNCTLDDIANTLQDVRKRTDLGKYTPYESSGFKDKKWKRRKISFTTVVQQTTMPKTFQRKRKNSMPLRKSQRGNPQPRILNHTLWVMPSENNLMVTKTQENNF